VKVFIYYCGDVTPALGAHFFSDEYLAEQLLLGNFKMKSSCTFAKYESFLVYLWVKIDV
jgi:2-hydroxy-3-keto-5-methylthiopentenyl-1-phosphate phosphatase